MKQDCLNRDQGQGLYREPVIVVQHVRLEDCITAASAVVTSPLANAQPGITDWEEEKDEQSWDF